MTNDGFKLRIVCAANRYKDLPLILGPRHWDETMHKMYTDLNLLYKRNNWDFPEEHEFEQGFIDNRGNYQNRQQAWIIAKEAKQIIRIVGGDTSKGGTLFSENLY